MNFQNSTILQNFIISAILLGSIVYLIRWYLTIKKVVKFKKSTKNNSKIQDPYKTESNITTENTTENNPEYKTLTFSSGNLSVVNGISNIETIFGSGILSSKILTFEKWSSIFIDGFLNVEIFRSRENRVEISADEELLPLIIAKLVNGNLSFDFIKSFTFKGIHGLKIFIYTIDDFENIRLDGVCSLVYRNIQQSNLTLKMDGTSKAIFAGSLDFLKLKIDGVAKLEGKNLDVNNCEITSDGVAKTKINTKEIKGKLGGVSKLSIPKNCKQSIKKDFVAKIDTY